MDPTVAELASFANLNGIIPWAGLHDNMVAALRTAAGTHNSFAKSYLSPNGRGRRQWPPRAFSPHRCCPSRRRRSATHGGEGGEPTASPDITGVGGSRGGVASAVEDAQAKSLRRVAKHPRRSVVESDAAPPGHGHVRGRPPSGAQKHRKLKELCGRLARAARVVRALRSRAAATLGPEGPSESSRETQTKEQRPARGGSPWDLLRGSVVAGVNSLDVAAPANQAKLQWQVDNILVVHFGIDCRTFSRAREIPRPGVPVRPLRSRDHPDGLPNLTVVEREAVQNANVMVEVVVEMCSRKATQGGSFIVENLARSRCAHVLRDLLSQLRLRRQNKEGHSAPEQPSGTPGTSKECKGTDICDFTHAQHAQWGVNYAEGRMQLDKRKEAKYPEELCRVLARIIAQAAADGRARSRGFDL